MSTEDKLTKEQRQELKRIHSVASGFQFTSLYPQEVKFLFNLINELAPEPKRPEPVVKWIVMNCEHPNSYNIFSDKNAARLGINEKRARFPHCRFRLVKLVEQPE